ncbi:MAG: hypothetical protein Q8R92_15765 [Deltaproteobacteria bacterium]|nr:hypothetical protein [Deltaproteobacteria bacterium]
MGVTIQYRGTLRAPRAIDEFCGEIRALIEPWGWEARQYEIASKRIRIMAHASGANEGLAVAGRQLPAFRARGLLIFPHFACDPMPFLIETHSGLLVDMERPAEKSTIEVGSHVKTQFAPIDVHTRICRFLYEVRDRFIPDLDVWDDGEYYRTGDAELLEIARQHVERELAEKAAEAAAKGAAWRVGYRVPRGEGHYRLLDFVVGSEKDPRFQLNSTVPSRIESGALVYVKRETRLFMTDQMRLAFEASVAHGKKTRLIVPKGAELSLGLRAALESGPGAGGVEESETATDAGLYLCVLDRDLDIDYGGIEAGPWSVVQGYREAINRRLEHSFLRKRPMGHRFPLFLQRDAGGWGAEELPALKAEIATILEEASRKPADPDIVPEYASRVRSRFRALHHCFVDTQVEPLLEKILALCDLGMEKGLPLVMQ